MTLEEIKAGLATVAKTAVDVAAGEATSGPVGAVEAAVTDLAQVRKGNGTKTLTPTPQANVDYGKLQYRVTDPHVPVTQDLDTLEEAFDFAISLFHKHHPHTMEVRGTAPIVTIHPVVTLSGAAAATHPTPAGSGSTSVSDLSFDDAKLLIGQLQKQLAAVGSKGGA